MKVKSIILEFENGDEMKLLPFAVYLLSLQDISMVIEYCGKDEEDEYHEYLNCFDFSLSLDKHFMLKENVDRILDCNDIAFVTINYEKGESKTYCTEWEYVINERDRHENLLQSTKNTGRNISIDVVRKRA